jgi:hypothetical protein
LRLLRLLWARCQLQLGIALALAGKALLGWSGRLAAKATIHLEKARCDDGHLDWPLVGAILLAAITLLVTLSA